MPEVRFETLIERHHDEIYGYLWRLTNSSGQSEAGVEPQDLTQEVFLRAYQAFGRLRPDSNHRAWLFKIATNCAYTALERHGRQRHHSLDPLEAVHRIPASERQSPDRQVILNETLEVVRKEIAALPPKQQAAVVMRHVQGLDYATIAGALACSEDSARANVYQGLRRLRTTLANAGIEGSGIVQKAEVI
jgi:RNA polymerase sigma-70 factor (ECF subfamily)